MANTFGIVRSAVESVTAGQTESVLQVKVPANKRAKYSFVLYCLDVASTSPKFTAQLVRGHTDADGTGTACSGAYGPLLRNASDVNLTLGTTARRNFSVEPTLGTTVIVAEARVFTQAQWGFEAQQLDNADNLTLKVTNNHASALTVYAECLIEE